MTRTSASIGTIVPAFAAPCPSTSTWPARISARAFSRDSTRPLLDEQRVEPLRLGASCKPQASTSLPQALKPYVLRSMIQLAMSARRESSRPARSSAAPRVRVTVGGERARSVEAEERRIGRLAGGASLPAVLPSVAADAFHVEDVVDDLEREPDLACRSDRARRTARRRRRP